jgi:hypothetical protein
VVGLVGRVDDVVDAAAGDHVALVLGAAADATDLVHREELDPGLGDLLRLDGKRQRCECGGVDLVCLQRLLRAG